MLIQILNWSEVWAPLIPLLVFILKAPKNKHLDLIAAYLFTAFCINAIIDVSWQYQKYMPAFLFYNAFLYNINSFCRIIFFVLFFSLLANLPSKKTAIFFLILYLIIFVVYFIINKNFNTLNSPLHSTESLILLLLSIVYLIRLIQSDEIYLSFDPYLLIISGLAVYESVNFFVFLFYDYLAEKDRMFDHYLWNVHNIIFIIFCVLIARAFLGGPKTIT